MKKIKRIQSVKIDKEIKRQKMLVAQLKQSLLQEAIEGKLTQKWREQNPNIEPASKLLERIKAEKKQLIIEKKIKKENKGNKRKTKKGKEQWKQKENNAENKK